MTPGDVAGFPVTKKVEDATALDSPVYRAFYTEVAARQLSAWLPPTPSRILDLSGGSGEFATLMAKAGHDVVSVVDPVAWRATDTLATPACHEGVEDSERDRVPGRVLPVVAETSTLGWVADASVDAVVAENRALSSHLAAERTVEHIARVVRPGGRLLLCVDSLVLGLARLAEQSRWAELADVPAADVVLVPSPDGSITRCFWPEELRELLGTTGFDVEWVRPRTVLSREAVERAVARDPAALATLIATEVALAGEREGESVGIHLLVSGVRR